ncbi:MAG: WD40 repeat domain-containing serine/threonine protein kinase [Gemmataceae bacterium]
MSERDLFIAALAQPDAAGRAAWLDRACAGDADLRRRVEALLSAHERASQFLRSPAFAGDRPIPTDATRSADDPELTFLRPADQPGEMGKLGPYDVLEVVGRGGMGVVLKAFDPKLHRVVAIKAVASHLAASPAARRRFEREARAVAAVRHEHVVAIHDVEPEGARPYLVMEFIGGTSLQERLDQRGSLELKEILRIGMQAASGLAAAHAQGLVHRDVKPANILLENDIDRVKLTDFGLARAVDDASLTQSGVISGTPNFMSPEQAAGEPVDHRSDLFSLGAVLYAMCTGHPPFRADSALAVLKRVCDDPARPIRDTNPDIPAWLDAIVLKLLAKNPADRFQTAAEVADLLGRHLAHLQQPAGVPLPEPVAMPAAERPRRWMHWLAIAVVLLAGFVVLNVVIAKKRGRFIANSSRKQAEIQVINGDPDAQVFIGDGNQRVAVTTGGGAVGTMVPAGRELSLSVIKGHEIHHELFHLQPREKRIVRLPLIVVPGNPVLRLTTARGELAPGTIAGMHLSPDLKAVAVRRTDNQVSVHGLDDGRERFSVPLIPGHCDAFGFSPDGKWLVIAAVMEKNTSPEIRAYDAMTGETGPSIRPTPEMPLSNSHHLAFSPDGKELAVASAINTANLRFRTRVQRWEWPSGQPLAPFEGIDEELAGLQYMGGRYLVTVTKQGAGTLWPLKSIDSVRSWSRSTETDALAVSKDGQMATATYNPNDTAGEFAKTWLFPRESTGDQRPLRGSPIRFGCVAFSPDGKLLAAGNRSVATVTWEKRAAIRLYGTDLADEKALLLGHTAWTLDLAFEPDGKGLVSVGSDGLICRWKLP